MSQAPLAAFSRFLGASRWAFMPLGLLALIAVGVHAAADTLDDRLLVLVDALDAAFDEHVGRAPLPESASEFLVDLLSIEGRTTLARVLALLWELAADVVLALPALGYRERDPDAPRAFAEAPPESWRGVLKRCLRAPTPMRWLRPLATALVVVAGACVVARLVRGTVYLSWRELLGETAAEGLARGLALAVLAGLVARLGARAVLRNLQHADAVSLREARGFLPSLVLGLPGSVVVVPLALAAAVDASPLASFLR